MTTSQTISELLPQLMTAVGAIGKDRRNQHQNYQFRGIDDVLNHVGPPCAELGIRVSPTIHDYQSNVVEWEDGGKHKFQVRVTLRMRLEFTAPDGSIHVAEAVGEAIDTNGDKASNKAMSAAFKYACFMGIVIPVAGALDDSDADDKQPTRPAPQKPAIANPRANTGTPARPAQRQTTRPAARTAEPSKPTAATEDQKQRFIEMVSPIEDSAIELFQKWGWLEPDQVLEDLTLDHVPTTQKLAAALINDIQAFMDGGVAGDPPWTPSGKPASPTVNSQDFQEPFWNIIIPVPRRGEKRADYMKNPDTIRSLYEAGKNGDDDARKRLFGFANNWEPTGWEKRDGTKMPPSEADNAARAALDQFLEWEKEKER